MVDTFRLALILTERCNVECRHCWFSSGSTRNKRMSYEDGRLYIDQAAEFSSIEWISMTGGEPFLMPELLHDLTCYASGRGFMVECVTNCSWAGTEEESEHYLGKLVDAGLDAINISTDDFHQQEVPFDRVRHCYNAAKDLGLKIVVMCASSKSSELGISEIVKRLDDDGIHDVRTGPHAGAHQVSALAVESGFIPVGRASTLPREEWMVGDSPLEGPCSVVLRDIGITSSGRVLPCCSASSILDHFHLGYANVERLSFLLNRAWSEPLFKVLSELGPMGLTSFTTSPDREYYVNRCHLCYDVLSGSRRVR